MIRYLAAASAALAAIAGVVVGYPGDIVSQEVILLLLAGSAGSSAFVAFLTNQPPTEV